jgi:hypothetical protein
VLARISRIESLNGAFVQYLRTLVNAFRVGPKPAHH